MIGPDYYITVNIKKIINPAGAIYYHINAIYYKKNWQSFISLLNEQLMAWQPSCKNIVIFGGSGGYCLKPEFVNQFDEIVHIDPDPLASRIFKWRFQKNIQINCKNYFSKGLEGLSDLKKDFPNYSILFSNILGQIPYIVKIDDNYPQSFCNILANLLNDISWFSFHDLLSLHFNKPNPALCWPVIIEGDSNNDLIDRLQQQTQLRPLKINIIDHFTEGLLPQTKSKIKLVWPRTPTSYHIIEATSQT